MDPKQHSHPERRAMAIKVAAQWDKLNELMSEANEAVNALGRHASSTIRPEDWKLAEEAFNKLFTFSEYMTSVFPAYKTFYEDISFEIWRDLHRKSLSLDKLRNLSTFNGHILDSLAAFFLGATARTCLFDIPSTQFSKELREIKASITQ